MQGAPGPFQDLQHCAALRGIRERMFTLFSYCIRSVCVCMHVPCTVVVKHRLCMLISDTRAKKQLAVHYSVLWLPLTFHFVPQALRFPYGKLVQCTAQTAIPTCTSTFRTQQTCRVLPV